MKHLRHRLYRYLLALVFLAPLACAAEIPLRISATQFRDEVAIIRATIVRMHPDPGFSADPQAVQGALDSVTRALPSTLSRDEAWQRLAVLNPLFADAHFFIGYPDWRGDTRAWLAAGGSLFPVEVEIGADGSLSTRDAVTSEPVRIVSVNGVAAAALLKTLSDKVHGDTPTFRANLLARRWWLFYWKTYGAPERYRLVLEQDGRQRTVEMPGSRVLPAVMREETPFALAIRPGGVAVLTVASFSQADPAPFLAFTRDAFARMRQEGVHTLVIDVSRNGGGEDRLWLEGLMPYIASKPYRTGSTYRGFMRAKPDQVVDGEITTWHQPQPEHPLYFRGKVYVNIGPDTYSSAILFANVMRDFGFATLVGTGGAARRSQSGGIRNTTLPHSGLVITVPRFILDPPAGRAPGTMLEAEAAPPGLDILPEPI